MSTVDAILEVQIDDICDQFESAWKEGLRPEIEQYLQMATEDARSMLLAELVGLDIQYRRSCGEDPTEELYTARFPDYFELLVKVFQRSGREHNTGLIEYSHFCELRRAVEDGVITDSCAEKLLRATPIGHPLLDTATSSSDLSKVAVKRLSRFLSDETASYPRVAGSRTADFPVLQDDADIERLETEASDIDPGRTEYPGLPLRYELVRVLGKGGMGLVFNAFDRNLRRSVAIKILPTHDSVIANAMQDECEILAHINHAGIVSIYDSGHLADGRPYIVMECVDGTTLDNCALGPKCSELYILRLFRASIQALAVAHSLSIVHRDLKPSNIILASDGSPKILDFGLAKFIDSQRTEEVRRVGTINYASPEQLKGEPTDARTDVYSVGVMLYEALAGVRPTIISDNMTVEQIIEAKRRILPLRMHAPKVSRAVEAIVHKCLSSDLSQRYADASAISDDISRYFDRRPVAAFTRQHPLYWLDMTLKPGSSLFVFLLTVAVVFLMSLVAGFPLSTLWPVLAVVIGLQGGTLLMREAQVSQQGLVAKTCYYISSFILLFEGVLVIAKLMSP